MVDFYFSTNATAVIKHIAVIIREFYLVPAIICLYHFHKAFEFVGVNGMNSSGLIEIEIKQVCGYC